MLHTLDVAMNLVFVVKVFQGLECFPYDDGSVLFFHGTQGQQVQATSTGHELHYHPDLAVQDVATPVLWKETTIQLGHDGDLLLNVLDVIATDLQIDNLDSYNGARSLDQPKLLCVRKIIIIIIIKRYINIYSTYDSTP